MAEPRRLVNLPGYDTAPDIYETAETDDAATTVTQQTSPRSPPETSDTSSPSSSEDETSGVRRRRLYPQRARHLFAAESQRVDARSVDLSDRVDGKRKGYRVKSRRRIDEDEAREDEGLEARLARLRREVEECRGLAAKTEAAGGEDVPEDARQEMDALTRLIASIELPGRKPAARGTPTAIPNGAAPPTTAPTPLLEDEEAEGEQTLRHIAAFDARLAAVEQALGLPSADALTSSTAAPILPALTLLDQQLSALSTATSLTSLEASSARLHKLRADADAVAHSAAPAPTSTDEDSTADSPPHFLTREDAERLTSLYHLLPTLHALTPTVPALLSRLRSLRVLHTTAAAAAGELDDVEKRQQEMEVEMGAWKQGLERVEEAVREAAEANGRNGKVVEGWVRELEGRMKGLAR